MNQQLFSSVSQDVGAVGRGARSTRSTRSACSRTGRTLAATVLVAALLSGCAGSPEAEGTPNTSKTALVSDPAAPTATPTPTPTATPIYKPASADGPAQNVPLPTLPPEATKETKAGLEAFAKYWYDTVEYAYETGNLEPLKEASGPNCTSCKYAYNVVEQGFENNDWLAGGEFKFSSEDTNFTKTPEGIYQILLQVTQGQVTSYAGDGSVASVLVEEPPAIQIMEAKFSEGWIAENVETISSP